MSARRRSVTNQLLIALGSIGTFVLALIGAVRWFNTPTTSLVAEVEYSAFKWPPTLDEAVKSSFRKAAIHSRVPAQLHPRLEEILEMAVADLHMHRLVDRIDSVWFVKIKNDGGVPTSSVSIKFPKLVFADLQKEGLKREVFDWNDLVHLGDLRPQEVVYLTAWGNFGFLESDASQIRISHASGLGSVVVRAPANPVWVWADRNWRFFAWLTFFAIMLLVTFGFLSSLWQNAPRRGRS